MEICRGRIWRTLFAIGALCLPEYAFASDYVWIVGGGPNINASQASIELNVKWLREVVRRQAPAAKLKIYYTDGRAPTSDVVTWRDPRESAATLQPLARVFGEQRSNGFRYHSNTIPGVDGGTRVDRLSARLKKDFAALKPGDRAFFIFNGHGTFDSVTTANNAMRLWDDTWLTVRDLEKLLSGIDPAVQVRLFLPQCFAGAFSRVVHPHADNVQTLAAQNRCGFMAVAENKEAEGCTPSVDVGDYRDYSTYFFSAIDGRTRLGGKLRGNPDLDGDGKVSLREAHFYSLIYGDSTDVPRTTSEVYLEQWHPWYLRWLSGVSAPDNIYGKLAAKLATRMALPVENHAQKREIARRRGVLQAKLDALKLDKERLGKAAAGNQHSLRAEVIKRWPAVQNPYTYEYSQFLKKDLNAAQSLITKLPGYTELVRQQEQEIRLDQEILDTEREMAQIDKIRRLRRLAVALDRFERYADAQSRKDYYRLVACESSAM